MTLGPIVDRLIEQWEPLQKYFTDLVILCWPNTNIVYVDFQAIKMMKKMIKNNKRKINKNNIYNVCSEMPCNDKNLDGAGKGLAVWGGGGQKH